MLKELQGRPYVWAEEGPNNFDCSGFIYYMYGSMGIEIPRVAREQAKTGCDRYLSRYDVCPLRQAPRIHARWTSRTGPAAARYCLD